MKRFDLAYPCRADFGSMPEAAGGRFCADCNEVVHDLSALDEAEARALLARTPSERVCVRYVYDAQSGELVFGARAAQRSALVPEHRLLARLKSHVAMAAAIAAPLLVEACGGNDGNRDRSAESTGQNDEELMSADGGAEYDDEPSEDAGPDGASLRDDDVDIEVGAAEGAPEPDPQR